jgi:hypothetical protein
MKLGCMPGDKNHNKSATKKYCAEKNPKKLHQLLPMNHHW